MTRPFQARFYRLAPLLVCLLGLAAPPAAVGSGSEVYRTVDEDGNVVFTDVAPRPGEQGEAVELEPANRFEAPPAGDSRVSLEAWLGEEAGPAADDGAHEGYETLRITAPAHDAAVRDNAGNVVVQAEIQPPLQSGHAVQLFLDGVLRQTAASASIPLENVDRGTHSVRLRVVDAQGQTVIESEPSVFHLQRRSVILQPSRGR